MSLGLCKLFFLLFKLFWFEKFLSQPPNFLTIYKRMPRGQLKNYKIGNRSYSITQLLDYEGVREVVAS